MAEMRVERAPSQGGLEAVSPDQRRQREPQQERRDSHEERRGSEELAVALQEHGRGPMVARFEQDAEGQPLVRIVDREHGDTIALLTPDELRALAERTGLPTGLLVQVVS
jgi:hypothetical protein